MVIPNWRNILQESIKKNDAEPALDYVQLGTIKPYGKPTNRTVHFQSFFNEHPTEKNNKFVSMLMFFVDVRTIDILDVLDGSPYGEVCMYLPITHEVFRLSGKLYIISSINSSIYSRVNYKNKIFSKFGYNMEKERLNQWKDYILPIHTNIPNKFIEEKKSHENDSSEKKEYSRKNIDNTTKSKLYLIENDKEDDNYLSINPRSIMVDDYLNYHNLNQDKLIQREENDLVEENDLIEKDDCLFTDASGDSNDTDSSIKRYRNGMDVSKQMDFKPYHRHYSPYKRYHRHLSDPGLKSSEESSSGEYYHSNCELCRKMLDERKKEHRSYSLSMEDLKKEMVDNFCLLLLDADKVYYSNYDYIPLKILEYTRTYSAQEDIMSNMYLSHHEDFNANDFQLTLSNTYTSLDFNNLKNVKLLHSNHLLDSAPLVSSPTITNDKKEEKPITKQEEWNCTIVNYAFLS